MRPKSIVMFERVLLAALAIDLVNNLMNWEMISESLTDSWIPPSSVMVLGVALLPVIVGLIFWYFITRRRSRVAKWLMTLFVAIGVMGFVMTLMRVGSGALTPLVILAGISEAMKVFAVSRLFTREAEDWLGQRPAAAVGSSEEV